MTKKVSAKVPVVLEGESLAVKAEGGILVTVHDMLEVSCLPADLPSQFVVNISVLEKFHDSITVAAIKVPIGVALVKAPQGELLMINQTGAQLLGGTLGCEVNSSHYLAQCNFLKEDETPYPFEELPISLTFKKQEIITKDNIIVRGINGEKVVLRITSAPVKNAQGQLTSVVTLLEDITEKRQIENMKNECLEFLYGVINKFKPERGSKAFSYFNVVGKNWLTIKSKQNTKAVCAF
jgi:hypothetical protein